MDSEVTNFLYTNEILRNLTLRTKIEDIHEMILQILTVFILKLKCIIKIAFGPVKRNRGED